MASVQESNYIAFLKPKSEEAISSLQAPFNSKFLDHGAGNAQIALQFSKAPRDWTAGFVFGRQEDRCDFLLGRDGISRRHFCIALNATNGNPILVDVSSGGTVVESRQSGRVHVNNTSVAIFDGDVIQAGLSRFVVEIPLHTEQNRETYLLNVSASCPPLDGLSIQQDPQFTMQEQRKLSLVTDETKTLPGWQKAVDFRGDFYAVRKRSKRETSCWDKNFFHVSKDSEFSDYSLTLEKPHFVTIFPEKFLDLSTERLVVEWPTYGSLAEQTLVSAHELIIVLQEILEATVCLHENNIVHRGIEPSNIWIMSRRPMKCKLGRFSSTANPAYLAPEVYSGKPYLCNDYPADIWSLGLTVLRYSLFGRWHMPTSKWAVEQFPESQSSRPDPGWQMLTGIANAMLHIDGLSRLSAKECLSMITGQDQIASSIDRPGQIRKNIGFLSRQESLPGCPLQLKPLILDLKGEALQTVDNSTARRILKSSQAGLKAAQRSTLLQLAESLKSLSSMDAQTNAIYVSNLHEYVEHVHLAKCSTIVSFLHDSSDRV